MNAYLKQYLEAFTSLIQSGASLEKVLENTRLVMKQRGHERLYPRLLRQVARVVPVMESKKRATLTVAKREDAANYGGSLEGASEAVVKVDHSLVGGYVFTKHHARQDHSYKTKLLTWYRRSIDDIGS